MDCRMLRLAVFAVDIRGNGMTGTLPRAVVDGVAPVSPQCGRRFAQTRLAGRADPTGATSIALVL
jgi:hypothetical protein